MDAYLELEYQIEEDAIKHKDNPRSQHNIRQKLIKRARRARGTARRNHIWCCWSWKGTWPRHWRIHPKEKHLKAGKNKEGLSKHINRRRTRKLRKETKELMLKLPENNSYVSIYTVERVTILVYTYNNKDLFRVILIKNSSTQPQFTVQPILEFEYAQWGHDPYKFLLRKDL